MDYYRGYSGGYLEFRLQLILQMEKAATTQSLGFGVKGTGVLGSNGRFS